MLFMIAMPKLSFISYAGIPLNSLNSEVWLVAEIFTDKFFIFITWYDDKFLHFALYLL